MVPVPLLLWSLEINVWRVTRISPRYFRTDGAQGPVPPGVGVARTHFSNPRGRL